MRDQYMRTGDGFLCVYSITYAASFQEVQALHDHILRVKDTDAVPFVLAGNKVTTPLHANAFTQTLARLTPHASTLAHPTLHAAMLTANSVT